ncbi:MAG: transporter [Deltaproteobacteria bacterium]|nr:transporter [Deltaproteobacteria bacterium]
MEIDVQQLLSEQPLLLTFLLIGSGYLLGSVRIFGVAVGTTAGVLLVGLLLGHLGFPDSAEAANFGFAVFIFCVGVQAGPAFFGALREDGSRYLGLAVIVAATSVALAATVSRLLELEAGLGAGLLAGALTSTPTLAGAQDAIASGLANLPEGVSEREATQNVSVGYALTYLFGTVGLIGFVRFLPRVLSIDLPQEAAKLARERGIGIRRYVVALADRLPVVRAYRVQAAGDGKTIEEQRVATERRLLPLRLRRAREILEPRDDLVLQEGDIISVVGAVKDHLKLQKEVGQEILDPGLIDFSITTHDIVVSHASVSGKALGELGLRERYGCVPVGLTRASIDLAADDRTTLLRGDRLRVTGEDSRVTALAERLGYVEGGVEETDLVAFSFGMVLGLLLGTLVLVIAGVSLGLGTSGGLLISGIALGFLSSINPTFGRMPVPARNFLMEFGLMLFMAEVGLRAGAGVVEALTSFGPAMIAGGVLVTLGPAVVGYLVGHYGMKLNPALLLGSLTGSMTSTPSLNVVSEVARSSVPSLGYAGTYTFANVLLTFAGTVMVRL